MRSLKEWEHHPQGKAIAAEPLIDWSEAPILASGRVALNTAGPLDGVRVLDLTRVLAGPVATRFLAAFGANVLRIDPPSWDEPNGAPGLTCTTPLTADDSPNFCELRTFWFMVIAQALSKRSGSARMNGGSLIQD